MQFVRGGPDIPERLLQAHEDEHVVFFCGAGISYPARLPSFFGLVEKLYDTLAPVPSRIQQAAIKAKQFDTAIGLLEAEITGGRELVRREVANILTPDLTTPSATTTHDALLTLGKTRDGRTRIITTNFDRLFEEVIAANSLAVKRFRAPLLPVPKNRWDGLVYLHGLLSPAPTEDELDQLVISSGDFGLAYLTERWASRFVSELFRNCIVCFVGYSLNDPVLRYMMDALAADGLRGESPSEIFAFGSYSKGKYDECESEWRAKNVIPILYREHNRHSYLHRTLRAWADTYRDGVRGKERIIVQDAIAKPLASTKQDDFVGRVLWALSDLSGVPAKRFADLDPVPSLDWLEPLSGRRYHHSDLARFDVPPRADVNEKLEFSIICRPSPYTSAPWMALVNAGAYSSRWDKVMVQLARWLTRHLNDPATLLWLAKHGGQLTDELVWWIDHTLSDLAKLERDGDVAKLAAIQKNAPNAIPSPWMCTLWRLLLTGRVKSPGRDVDLYRWQERFECYGLTATLRIELREALAPRIVLRESVRWSAEDNEESEPRGIKDLVDWEVALSADHFHSTLRGLSESDKWKAALPSLLSDANTLLLDALDLMRELRGAGHKSDLSYLSRPSIGEHPQNRDFREWTALIDLVRDAWLATAAQSKERAAVVAESWWRMPYPLFKRLAFFAASQGETVTLQTALKWLLADDAWWIWSVETEREAMRLLVLLAPQLDQDALVGLERAILAGPPRTMFKDSIEPERWTHVVDRDVWLRLAKLQEANASLSTLAQDRLNALSAQYPQWELEPDQRDEFPFWMSSGNEWRQFVATPRHRRDLVEYLRRNPSTKAWQEDDWRQRCRDNFSTTTSALCALAKEHVWPVDRWREALQAWSEEKLLRRSWRYMAPTVAGLPHEVLNALDHAVSWWLQAVAKTFEGHETSFFALAHRILGLDDLTSADTDEPVTRAINHPIGHATEALLRWWYRQSLEDEQGLPGAVKPTFTQLCNTQVERFRHGRVLLAAHVIALFRVDTQWAEEHLLALFDWRRSEVEARAAWEGFLWSPRLYRPLMESLKLAFLDTAHHYAALDGHGGQYASLLTFAALDPGDTFTRAELASATAALPPEGLQQAAEALARGLEASADQRAEYWANRIVPYLRGIWPRAITNASHSVAASFGRLCIAAKEDFPEALNLLRPWLVQPSDPGFLVHLLNDSGLCKQFPLEALEFLNRIVTAEPIWLLSELKQCLRDIRAADAGLETDLRFQRLVTYIRERGEEWF